MSLVNGAIALFILWMGMAVIAVVNLETVYILDYCEAILHVTNDAKLPI